MMITSSLHGSELGSDPNEQLLNSIAAVAEVAVNQWAVVLASMSAELVSAQIRAALRDGRSLEPFLKPRVSFEPVRLKAVRTSSGCVVTQGRFDPTTIDSGAGTNPARGAGMPIGLSTSGVPVPRLPPTHAIDF